MKKVLSVLLMLVALHVQAQTLVMSDETSDINFVTTHLAGRLEGTFKGVQGTSEFNPNDLAHSYLKLSFATSTIVTNDNVVGPNFIKAGCFNSGKYPNIEIASDSISKLPGENQFQFKGSLTVKGVTHPVSFPFTAKANVGGYDFKFAFSFVKRKFGLHCGATGRKFKIDVRAYAKGKELIPAANP